MSRIGNDSNVLFQPRHHGDARDTRTAGSVATSTSPPRRQCLPRYETTPPAPAGAVKAAGDPPWPRTGVLPTRLVATDAPEVKPKVLWRWYARVLGSFTNRVRHPKRALSTGTDRSIPVRVPTAAAPPAGQNPANHRGPPPHADLDAYLTDARKAATLGQRLTALSWVAKSRSHEDSHRQMPARRGAEPEHRTVNTALPPKAGPLRVKARCTPLGRVSAQTADRLI